LSNSPAINNAAATSFRNENRTGIRANSSLKQMIRHRRILYESWLLSSENVDSVVVAEATDHLIGLHLLLLFVKQVQPAIAFWFEGTAPLGNRQTVRGLASKFHRFVSSPILQAAIEPNVWNDALQIPEPVRQSFIGQSFCLRLTLNSFLAIFTRSVSQIRWLRIRSTSCDTEKFAVIEESTTLHSLSWNTSRAVSSGG
jgi:hypothetical protein